MGYIDKTLVPGEKVVYRGAVHWVLLIVPGLLLAAAVACGIGARYREWLLYPAAVFAGIGLIAAIRSTIARRSSEFAVTNRRVIAKVGFLHSHSVEILLTKVEGITVDQDVLGNILNYGTIGIKGTGGTEEKFPKISDPFEFRRRTQEQIVAGQDTTVHWGAQTRG